MACVGAHLRCLNPILKPGKSQLIPFFKICKNLKLKDCAITFAHDSVVLYCKFITRKNNKSAFLIHFCHLTILSQVIRMI